MKACDSCGSTHMAPVPCGLTWRQRVGSVRVDDAALETRDLKNYYDNAAVEANVGHDSVDRLYDETDGIGYVRQDNNGVWWKRKKRGSSEIEKATEKDLQVLTGQLDGADD